MLAGWRLALSVGLAGVQAAGRRGNQGSGGVRLEGAAQAGDRAGGLLLIGQADTAQAGQIGQAVTAQAGQIGQAVAVIVGAAGFFPVLIGAAVGLIGAGVQQAGRRKARADGVGRSLWLFRFCC